MTSQICIWYKISTVAFNTASIKKHYRLVIVVINMRSYNRSNTILYTHCKPINRLWTEHPLPLNVHSFKCMALDIFFLFSHYFIHEDTPTFFFYCSFCFISLKPTDVSFYMTIENHYIFWCSQEYRCWYYDIVLYFIRITFFILL